MGTGYDPLELVAYGVVNGGVTPTFDKQFGIDAAIVRVSAGVYTITLSNPIDEADAIETATVRFPSTTASITVTHVDDATKTFRLSSSAIAADGDFSFAFRRAEI